MGLARETLSLELRRRLAAMEGGPGGIKAAPRILQTGVICTPGSAFGEAGEGHLRSSYANSQENIKRAMEIVGGVAEDLP